MRPWGRRNRRYFPWNTLITLVLLTWSLGLVASLWIQAMVSTLAGKVMLTGHAAWMFTFATYFSWEPWLDGAILAVALPYLGWRWAVLLKALWQRWRG